MWSCPPSPQRLGLSGRYTEALRASTLGIIPEASRAKNSQAVPLVWCTLAPEVQPGPHQVISTINETDVFTPFLPPQPKPGPYFTARYVGIMGIK